MLAPFLFSLFLLYLFWAKPAAILSQEYSLADLFLTKNIFVIISAVSFILFLLAGALGFFFFPKFLDGFTAFTAAFVLAMTLFRYILPYNYGVFADNISCAPRVSLLGFSPWYYLLDAFILLGMPLLAFFLIKKKQAYKFGLILLLFYAVEFVTAVSSIKLGEANKAGRSLDSLDITLSQNHPNVLVIIYDSLSSAVGKEFFTRHIPEDYKNSIKDFTIYDNFINPASGHTIIGLPMMFGGADFSEQNQFAVFTNPSAFWENLKKERAAEAIEGHIFGGTYYYSDWAVNHFKKRMPEESVLQYRQMPAFREETDSSGVSYATAFSLDPKGRLLANTPIVYVPLYSSIPYFVRHFLANEFSWKYTVTEGWLHSHQNLRLLSTETKAGVLEVLHNEGAHMPHTNPIFPISYYAAQSPEDMYNVFMGQLTYNAGILPYIIKRLKALGVYDQTKIIILSDHGFSDYDNKGHSLGAIKKMDIDAELFFRKAPFDIASTPAFLMVKDIGVSQNSIKIDSRFLAMPDIPGIMLSALQPSSGIPDYTHTMPPKRRFIFPVLPDLSLLDTSFIATFTNKHLENGQITLAEFSGVYNYSLKKVPFTSFEDLPKVEQIIQ